MEHTLEPTHVTTTIFGTGPFCYLIVVYNS